MINYEKHRKNIEKLYEHTCTVLELKQIKDPDTGVTRPKEVEVYTDIPCRLSNINQVNNQGELVDSSVNKAKLFIAPEIEIKEGSTVRVNQYGKIIEYKRSTHPFRYASHLEYELTFVKEVN